MKKKLVIVGAGPGVGAGAAHRFGREGWRVVLVGRNGERLATMAETLGAEGIEANPAVCDITDIRRLDALIRKESDDGGIDYLLYNAAGLEGTSLLSYKLDEIVPDLVVGIAGAIVAARAAAPGMIAKGDGVIVFVGGELGVNPWPDILGRGVHKAGLRNLAQALSKDRELETLRIGYVNIDGHVSHPGMTPFGYALLDTLYELASVPRAAFPWNYDHRPPYVRPVLSIQR